MSENPPSTMQNVHLFVDENGWPVRLALSIGFAGFLAFMGQLSFPVPWTPVPFSMMPFALLITGAYQRPLFAVVSVVVYLLAGALGAPIYAEGSSGWDDLFGNTAGYLFGYVLMAAWVSWYVQARRRLLSRPWALAISGLIGVLLVAASAVIGRLSGSGTGFAAYGEDYASWGVAPSILWVLAFVTVAAGAVTVLQLLRARGHGLQALNLFLVMLAGTALLHLCGVLVLWQATDLGLMASIVLGSIVFLPFDILKAGLAVGLSLPFLPAPRGSEANHVPT